MPLALAFSSEVQQMIKNGNTYHSEVEELADIRDVHISKELPREKRIEQYIRQIKNPYHFKCGDIIVHICFAQNGPTLEECIARIMR